MLGLGRTEATNGQVRWPVGVPAAALGTAHVALTELLDTLASYGADERWTAEDVVILEAVEEIVAAAHARFLALRIGRVEDMVGNTARLQVAAARLRDASRSVESVAA